MAKKPTQMSNREARKMLEKDVAAFLKSGNKIQQIPRGVSGQEQVGGRKQLVMTPKPKANS